jgi:hypothetical protein
MAFLAGGEDCRHSRGFDSLSELAFEAVDCRVKEGDGAGCTQFFLDLRPRVAVVGDDELVGTDGVELVGIAPLRAMPTKGLAACQTPMTA